MNKLLLSALYLIFAAAGVQPVYASAFEKPIVLCETEQVQIIKIEDIDDEVDPEAILGLENGLRLLTKWYNGVFYVGQTVGIRFDEKKLFLELETYDQEGKAGDVITFFRCGENSHFYQAL